MSGLRGEYGGDSVEDTAREDERLQRLGVLGADLTAALAALYVECDGDEITVGEFLHEANKAARASCAAGAE